jgi:hypothetical protein
MWQILWPGLPEHEVPIGSITNGVHFGTWVDPEIDLAYRRFLGEDWDASLADPATWAKIADVPDAELWAVHERCRARLIAEIPLRIRALSERKGFPVDPKASRQLLDPHALTIGFARRFATYKRGTLLLRDAERLHRILCREGRPVQLVFAGKAHPQDMGRKRAHPRDRQGLSQRRLPREDRLRRGLRHERGSLAGGRLRRLAQHPAPPPRGQRHERDEGLSQRRLARQRARRLVGRGLRRATTASPSAMARSTPIPTTAIASRRRPSIACSRTTSCRSSTRATPRACPAAGSRG